MNSVSGHEAGHARGRGARGPVPADPNDTVVRAVPPPARALAVVTVAAIVTLAVLLSAAVAAGRGL